MCNFASVENGHFLKNGGIVGKKKEKWDVEITVIGVCECRVYKSSLEMQVVVVVFFGLWDLNCLKYVTRGTELQPFRFV